MRQCQLTTVKRIGQKEVTKAKATTGTDLSFLSLHLYCTDFSIFHTTVEDQRLIDTQNPRWR